MSYFRAESLSLHFGGLKAVDAVSFAVEKGEILSIIGPNGAGKSSIFNLISRIYRPTSGRIYFEDQDNSEDAVLATVPEERRATLIAAKTEDGYRFDVRLQGAGETVFFRV